MEHVKDCFGQPLEIGDEVYWVNKIAGRKRSIDKCTIVGATKSNRVKLKLANGELRVAAFHNSLGKMNVAEDQTLSVGDHVLYGDNDSPTRYRFYFCTVTAVTDKWVSLKSEDPYYETYPTFATRITLAHIVKVSPEEKERLFTAITADRKAFEEWEREHFRKIEESGVNPFTGNPFAFSGNTLKVKGIHE